MKKEYEKEEQAFIREHIATRKNPKRIFMTILSTVGIALLFGAVAGVTFSATRRIMEEDRMYDTPIMGTVSHSLENVDAENTSSKPQILPQNSGNEKLRGVYKNTEKALLRVEVSTTEGANLFGREVTSVSHNFGVIIAESRTYIYALYDSSQEKNGSTVDIYYDNTPLTYEVMGKDPISGLAVIRAEARQIETEYSVVSIGNSSPITVTDDIYMIGTQTGRFVALEAGTVIIVTDDEEVTDGYRKLIYTTMHRDNYTSAMLLNEGGELVGWVSNTTARDSNQAIGWAFNTLRHVVENYCYEMKTAYLGLCGRRVTGEEAISLSRASGYYIQRMDNNSPALNAGLRTSDRILSIDGNQISSGRALLVFLEEKKPGQTVVVNVARKNGSDEEILEIPVRLGVR